MFKPLTAQLNEQFGGSPLTPALDPVKVARSFGVAYEVGESLPESPVAIRHVEDVQQESGLLLDKLTPIRPKAEPTPLAVIATRRLNSIRPRTREMAQKVAQAIADCHQFLSTIDELVGALAMQRVKAIEERLEQLRTRGREQRHRVKNELQGAVYTAMQIVNSAEQQKVMAQSKLDSRINRLRSLKMDRYSTDEQLADADQKVKSAVRKLNEAREIRLAAEKRKAEADNALSIGQSGLAAIEIAMDQCAAELAGQPYHSPEFGSSVDPLSHLQQ
jgi:hypothetical protein